MVEFGYRKETLHSGETIFRPVAKVYLLRDGKEWIPEYFYVDSGADYTLIPYKFGRFIGLDSIALDVEEISGIGGVVGIRFAVIPMKIEEHQFDCKIAWAQIERVPFLLGRENVFECFDITFKQRKRNTVFTWQED